MRKSMWQGLNELRSWMVKRRFSACIINQISALCMRLYRYYPEYSLYRAE